MKNLTLKIFVLLFLIGAVFLIHRYHLTELFTLEQLKTRQADFAVYYSEHPNLTLGAYFGVYILATALSLPGATILTLGSGALFGFWTGILLVSFASSLGATLAFLASRFFLRDFIQTRFADRLKTINEGVEKKGAFYLFTLRLIPGFPFFLINLAMGLTPIRTWTFYWVSQLGMLAGTAVYVNAGTQLSQIDSLKDILSLPLVASFAAIGLLPWVSKAALSYLRNWKLYRNFRRPRSFDYNIVVIGGGSAGLVSSYIAAAVKSKVALIEKHRMGGDCLNTGCVPSKALIRSAKILSYIRRSEEFGLGKASVNPDFSEVMKRVKRVITKIEPHDSRERYRNLGVDCIEGSARIRSPFEVEVNGKTLTTKNIVVATGARPLVPGIPGLDKVPYLTSDTIWDLTELPKKLLVIGGGPIGCELAQSFARLGSEVTMVEMAPRLMVREDSDVSTFVTKKLSSEGIRVLTSHTAKQFSSESGRNVLVCEAGGKPVIIEFDQVLLALGRKANVTGFGLEELNVKISKRGTIEHDEFLRTNYPNIYVCGDVAGPYQFTHTAAHQAWYAAVNSLFSPFKKFKADYTVIPWCTFTDPEVARVGLSEDEAKEQNIAYSVTKYEIDDLDRAITEEEDHGFIKVLTPPGKDKVLGVTIVGAHAGEIIAEYVSAMKNGIGLNSILGTIHIYPTLAESNKYVAGQWKKANAPEKLLEYVKKFHAWRRA